MERLITEKNRKRALEALGKSIKYSSNITMAVLKHQGLTRSELRLAELCLNKLIHEMRNWKFQEDAK